MAGWNNVFKSNLKDEEIEKIFQNIDVDKSGNIDYSGNCVLCLSNVLIRIYYGYPR